MKNGGLEGPITKGKSKNSCGNLLNSAEIEHSFTM